MVRSSRIVRLVCRIEIIHISHLYLASRCKVPCKLKGVAWLMFSKLYNSPIHTLNGEDMWVYEYVIMVIPYQIDQWILFLLESNHLCFEHAQSCKCWSWINNLWSKLKSVAYFESILDVHGLNRLTHRIYK